MSEAKKDDKKQSLEWAQQFQDAHGKLIAEMFGVFDATQSHLQPPLTLEALEHAMDWITLVYDNEKDEQGIYFIWDNDVPRQVARINVYGGVKVVLSLKNGDKLEWTEQVKVYRVEKALPAAEAEWRDDARMNDSRVRRNWKYGL